MSVLFLTNQWSDSFPDGRILLKLLSDSLQAFAYTESYFYLLFEDGRLSMYDPDSPRQPVRLFCRKAVSLHKGDRCLLVGVKNSSGQDTMVTDLALNVIDVMKQALIVSASSRGLAYVQDGLSYLEFGNVKIETSIADGQYHFFASCAIRLSGLTDKIVDLISVDSQEFSHLESFHCSPRWIPHVVVEAGPGDVFCLAVQQRDFGHIIVYNRNAVLLRRMMTSERVAACFIDEHLVMSASDERVMSIFRLPKLTYCCTFLAQHCQKIIVDEVSLYKGCLLVTEKLGGKSLLFCVRTNVFSKFSCLPPYKINQYLVQLALMGVAPTERLFVLPKYVIMKGDITCNPDNDGSTITQSSNPSTFWVFGLKI